VNFTYDCSLKGEAVETSFQTLLDLDQLGQVLLQVDACVLEITKEISKMNRLRSGKIGG
jgi:hypothetical protein